MNRQEKSNFVDEMHTRLENTAGVFLADFTGVSVAQDRDLRKKLAAAGIEMKVVKNTLFRRAIAKTQYEGVLESLLTGPNAVVLADDIVAAAKALTKYLEDNQGTVSLRLKGGALDGVALSADDVKNLSKLASREQLIGQFMGLLQTPLRQFAVLLQSPLRDIASVLRALEQKKSAQQ